MTFVQIIDCKTNRFDDMNRLMDTWVEQTKGKRTATHSSSARTGPTTPTTSRSSSSRRTKRRCGTPNCPRPDRVFQEIVALCDEMPTFTDLEVVRDEQLNKDSARRFFEEIATEGDLDAIDEVFAADYNDHDPANESGRGRRRRLPQEVATYRAGFDFRFTIEDQLAEGDQVATRWTWTCDAHGEFRGIAPTGKECSVTGITVFKFRDSKVQEGWWNYDNLGLLQQLDVVEMKR